MDAFINDLESVYTNELIYRSIIVCQNGTKSHVKDLLETYDHTISIINDIDTSIDYEKLDSRILLVSIDKFKSLIEYLDDKYGLQNVSYNLIAFTYDIDYDTWNNMKEWYIKKNGNGIII